MKPTRRILFILLTVFVVLVALELGSFLLLSFSHGGPYTWTTFEEQLASTGITFGDAAGEERGRGARYRAESRQTVHPFLGFVSDADTHPAALDTGNNRRAIEHGFPRNRHDPFLEPREDRYVVAVFGGSVAGNISAFEPYFLERELVEQPAFADKEVIVLSLANSGYKQPQQLMALNWFLALGAHFDLVVNLDGFNEVALPVAELLPNEVSPYFPRGWQLQVGDLSQQLRLTIARLSSLRERRAAWAGPFTRSPLSHSFLAALIWRLFDRPLVRDLAAVEVELLHHQASPSFHARGPSYRQDDPATVFADLADLWQRASLQMRALCEERGIRYVHFLQPNQYLEGSKPLSEEEKKKAWRADHPYRPGVVGGYPLLIERGEELRRRGVEFFDLTGIFAQNRGTLYGDACCHFNFRGNRLLALAMAQRIAEVVARSPGG